MTGPLQRPVDWASARAVNLGRSGPRLGAATRRGPRGAVRRVGWGSRDGAAWPGGVAFASRCRCDGGRRRAATMAVRERPRRGRPAAGSDPSPIGATSRSASVSARCRRPRHRASGSAWASAGGGGALRRRRRVGRSVGRGVGRARRRGAGSAGGATGLGAGASDGPRRRSPARTGRARRPANAGRAPRPRWSAGRLEDLAGAEPRQGDRARPRRGSAGDAPTPASDASEGSADPRPCSERPRIGWRAVRATKTGVTGQRPGRMRRRTSGAWVGALGRGRGRLGGDRDRPSGSAPTSAPPAGRPSRRPVARRTPTCRSIVDDPRQPAGRVAR